MYCYSLCSALLYFMYIQILTCEHEMGLYVHFLSSFLPCYFLNVFYVVGCVGICWQCEMSSKECEKFLLHNLSEVHRESKHLWKMWWCSFRRFTVTGSDYWQVGRHDVKFLIIFISFNYLFCLIMFLATFLSDCYGPLVSVHVVSW